MKKIALTTYIFLTIMTGLVTGHSEAFAEESPCVATPFFSCFSRMPELDQTMWLMGMACLTNDEVKKPIAAGLIVKATIANSTTTIVERQMVIPGTYQQNLDLENKFHYFYGSAQGWGQFSIYVNFLRVGPSSYVRINKTVYPIDCALASFSANPE